MSQYGYMGGVCLIVCCPWKTRLFTAQSRGSQPEGNSQEGTSAFHGNWEQELAGLNCLTIDLLADLADVLPNDISIGSATLAALTFVTERQADRQTTLLRL